MTLDLSLLKSVREFSKKFQLEYSWLDVLVNNAGGMILEKMLTEDNPEANIAGNQFGSFLIPNKLLGKINRILNRLQKVDPKAYPLILFHPTIYLKDLSSHEVKQRVEKDWVEKLSL